MIPNCVERNQKPGRSYFGSFAGLRTLWPVYENFILEYYLLANDLVDDR
ncbi:MAG: hypothetical protein IPH28_23165 [Cytophagaceae bacterium]|nr:hypothetical protein [Cytophagaceae bacterium]